MTTTEPTAQRLNGRTVYKFGGVYGLQLVLFDDGRVSVQLPHSCDEWVIAFEEPSSDAAHDLDVFTAEVQAVRRWMLRQPIRGDAPTIPSQT